MKKELGIARCGLACCLCSKNDTCPGCHSDGCSDKQWCKNRACSMELGLHSCGECEKTCEVGMLQHVKPAAFVTFIRKHGEAKLLEVLERNEKAGVVYHRHGFEGDYDQFSSVEELLSYLEK